MGSCPPTLSADQHAVIEGVLLGGAHATDGNLIVQTTSRSLVGWVVDRLGWLAGRLTAEEDNDQAHRTLYRLYTPAHPSVKQYAEWVDGPPPTYSLSPLAGRVWWAFAGHLEFQDQGTYRVGRISAQADEKAEWIQRLLSDSGVEGQRHHDYVKLSSTALRDWLRWIGDPVPGAEHLWAESEAEYQTLRTRPEA
jgi:hypothetical protein